ncbi:DUF4145 domain-containing protein [Psychrosphaera aestuarii]|uniref:DUF4145 domain-containing protein n=1 Tax=Psychrosphaera aestuarii TaxID=1266052 RepID=UPI001B32D24E|nr:DUF4145 domain-containing protein [Psychrosphaera aestuarii]
MNRSTWKSILGFVEIENYPDLPCPLCNSVSLNFDKSSIQTRPLTENYKKLASRHYKLEQQRKRVAQEAKHNNVKEIYETSPVLGIVSGIFIGLQELNAPEIKFELFNAFLVCDACDGNISCSGLKQKHINKNENEKKKADIYKVDYFSIPIPIIHLDKEVPSSIKSELYNAFSYFHFDTNGSAHKLRKAVEAFCLELKAKPNSLARQLKELSEEYPIETKLLHAIRLIGNEGTHSNGVEEEDLLIAFDIVEEVLQIFRKLKKLEDLKTRAKQLVDKFEPNKEVPKVS